MYLGKNIRFVTKDDISILTQYRNKYRYNFFNPTYITDEDTRNWLATKPVNDFMFIVQQENTTQLGQFGIYNIKYERPSHLANGYPVYQLGSSNKNTAEFGRIISYDTGNWIIIEICNVVNELIAYFDLDELTLETYKDNEHAITFFFKLGFQVCDFGEQNGKATLKMKKVYYNSKQN